MIEFILTRHGFVYELNCNNNLINSKRFNSENDAIKYYKNFITSWFKSTLTLKLT